MMKLSNADLSGSALPNISLKVSISLFAALVATAALTYVLTPHLTEVPFNPSLEDTVPHRFGDWHSVPSPYAQVGLTTGAEPNIDQPYDQTVMRTYVNSTGQQIMLALAWGRRQRQEVKIHRPDLCYVAQGYRITDLTPITFGNIGNQSNPIKGKHMIAMNSGVGEAVSYWIRIGNLYSESAVDTRLEILKQGLNGKIPDGILVRASARISSEVDAAKIFPLLDRFLVEMIEKSPIEAQALLARPQASSP